MKSQIPPLFAILGPDFATRKVPLYRRFWEHACGPSDPGVGGGGGGGGNGNITFRNNILRLQKRALRICTGSHYLAHSDPLFYNLHSLKINDINVLQTAVFMFKLNANLLPTTFDKLCSHNKNIHHYPTRVSHNFHLSNPSPPWHPDQLDTMAQIYGTLYQNH